MARPLLLVYDGHGDHTPCMAMARLTLNLPSVLILKPILDISHRPSPGTYHYRFFCKWTATQMSAVPLAAAAVMKGGGAAAIAAAVLMNSRSPAARAAAGAAPAVVVAHPCMPRTAAALMLSELAAAAVVGAPCLALVP